MVTYITAHYMQVQSIVAYTKFACIFYMEVMLSRMHA